MKTEENHKSSPQMYFQWPCWVPENTLQLSPETCGIWYGLELKSCYSPSCELLQLYSYVNVVMGCQFLGKAKHV